MATKLIAKDRSPGRFTFVPLAIFCILTFGFFWYSTQLAASLLAYQEQLGEPWLHIGSLRLYAPWAIFGWVYWYHGYAPQQFDAALFWCYVGPFASIAAVVAYLVWQARRAQQATTYGSARWATAPELAGFGLLDAGGVVLGCDEQGRYLRHDGPEHVISIAPTRSGKGVGQVIPTLFTWPGSVFVNDIKGENWIATAGYRSRFSHCIYLNPTDPHSAHFNPLLEVRPGPYQIKDVQNIADMIVDPDGKGLESHWAKTGHALLVGVLLHVLYAEEDKTLPGVARFLSDPRRSSLDTLHAMMTYPHADAGAHAVIASAAREMLNKSENERSGVLSTAMSFLGLYRDPIVAANVADSDFRIVDLMEAEHPLSIYLVVPPSDLSRTRPLVRLILTMIGRRLTEQLNTSITTKAGGVRRAWTTVASLWRAPAQAPIYEGGRNKHRLLLLIDEFPALGRLDFFETALAFIAGYGIKVFLIVQGINQLDKSYGPNNSIIDSCHVRAFYTPNDDESAKRISDLLGVTTEVHQQKTYTGHRLSPWLGHVMVADQEAGRPLLTPGEVLVFPSDELIVFMAGKPAVRGRKLRYFEDAQLASRILPPPALGARPYPYRPPAVPNPWAAIARAAAATTSTSRAAAAPVELAAEEVKPEPPGLPAEPPDHDKDVQPQGHQGAGTADDLALEAAEAEARANARRAQFDEDQNTKHHHWHKPDDRDFSL
jgi:type IV secretion system protein VirD4